MIDKAASDFVELASFWSDSQTEYSQKVPQKVVTGVESILKYPYSNDF